MPTFESMSITENVESRSILDVITSPNARLSPLPAYPSSSSEDIASRSHIPSPSEWINGKGVSRGLVKLEALTELRLPVDIQRAFKKNKNLIKVAETTRTTGEVVGAIYVGILRSNPSILYALDGQHRTIAAYLSGRKQVTCSFEFELFDSLPEMGIRFAALNSEIKHLDTGDRLAPLSLSSPIIQEFRRRCLFIGLRTNNNKNSHESISLTSILTAFTSGKSDNIARSKISHDNLISSMQLSDVEEVCNFLRDAREAWGPEPQHRALYKTVNLCVCYWLYRRMVCGHSKTSLTKATPLSVIQFRRGLAAVSANDRLLEWLPRAGLGDRHRSVCYERVISAMRPTLEEETCKKVKFPQPEFKKDNGSRVEINIV